MLILRHLPRLVWPTIRLYLPQLLRGQRAPHLLRPELRQVVSDTLPVLSNRTRLIRIGTATPTQQEESVTFNPAQIREFTPQNYDLSTVSFGISLCGISFADVHTEYFEWEHSRYPSVV